MMPRFRPRRMRHEPMTILYSDPYFQQHETGRHPERPERLRAIAARLAETGLAERCRAGRLSPLTEEAVASVHSPGMIGKVKQLAERGGGRVDADTAVSADSFQVA